RRGRTLRDADDGVGDPSVDEALAVTGDVLYREAGRGPSDEVLPGGDGDRGRVDGRWRAAGLGHGVDDGERLPRERVERPLEHVDGARLALLELAEVDVVDRRQPPVR